MSGSPRKPVLLNWVRLDIKDSQDLYVQLGAQIRDAILSEKLEPGNVLPASRVLSKELGVSRITVTRAYEQLAAEGFLETKRGSGTIVSTYLSRDHITNLAAVQEPLADTSLVAQSRLQFVDWDDPATLAFQPGLPAFDAFPRLLWSRLLAHQATKSDRFLLDYSHVGGYAPLRTELSVYLGGSRGLHCKPEQVVIMTSTRAAIAAVRAILWQKEARVVVEDPGYLEARQVLERVGCRLVPVPVDERGLIVSELLASTASCDGAYLTPAHHWPTGVALTADRRVRLLDWATRSGSWIIEDDYDSEFRFESRPLSTLFALGSGRVIYVGTFSKTFAPSVRTAYVVVPREYVSQFEEYAYKSATEPPLHVQAALAELLEKGHFTRHVSRMRKLYFRRRTMLLNALEKIFEDRLTIISPPGGLQVLVRFPNHVSSVEVSREAAAAGLHVRDLSGNYLLRAPDGLMQLGFAPVPEEEIVPAVQHFRKAVAHLL